LVTGLTGIVAEAGKLVSDSKAPPRPSKVANAGSTSSTWLFDVVCVVVAERTIGGRVDISGVRNAEDVIDTGIDRASAGVDIPGVDNVTVIDEDGFT
jgi:hypothetical protein